jgi:hypothetical protein
MPGGAGGQPRGPDRFHNPQVVAEFSQTAQQALQLSRSYQAVAAAQAGNHLLADPAPFPVGPDNVQIFIGSAISDTTFAPHEHDINMLCLKEICQYFSGLVRRFLGITIMPSGKSTLCYFNHLASSNGANGLLLSKMNMKEARSRETFHQVKLAENQGPTGRRFEAAKVT